MNYLRLLNYFYNTNIFLSFLKIVCLLSPKYRSQSVNYVWRHRMNSWRREWLKKSSQLGRRRILNAANFLAAQMLPWWLKCNKCGLWRQLPPQTTVGSSKCNYRPDKFTCADVVKVGYFSYLTYFLLNMHWPIRSCKLVFRIVAEVQRA